MMRGERSCAIDHFTLYPDVGIDGRAGRGMI
jgi:hypothetical protein